ncbi:hypothetical protein F5Y19DRAFT_80507 [Xylariaceae sp. FL1651]|nr:hypothetical protein F5Y19DRAFT_80507 [Xylariaceae sp. FL1651]
MASITDQLQSAAPRNKQLLEVLSQTDHAPPALEQQKRYVQDLDQQLSDVQKRKQSLELARRKELNDHEKYRDSIMKRWAYKVSGNKEKFAAKAEKEEKEYFEALQHLHQANTMEEHLKGMRSEALGVQSDLEQECVRHATAQSELDNLYASIFQGPTPSFPEEDYAERKTENALHAYNGSCAKLEADQQVQRILADASKRIQSSLSHIEDALDSSRLDMFGGGAVVDMMERDSLHNAEMEVTQAQMLIMQAQRFSSEVKNLPPVKISKGNLMSDVLFDNIFTDMAFHDKIKISREEVRQCQQALLIELTAAKERCQASEQEMKVHSDLLLAARNELQRSRQRIFERLATSEAPHPPPSQQPEGEGAPPPYS